MFKILISDNVANEALAIFKNYPQIQTDFKAGIKADELKNIIGEYHGLIVRSETKVTKEILDKASNLKIIGRAGAGVDNIDVEYSTKKGIIVMNTPGGNSSAVAELTIAFILALSRNIVPASISMKMGQWEKKKLAETSVEVADKVVGIIGAGNIGAIVASRVLGLKMKVIVYDPFLTKEKAHIMGVNKVNTIDEVFKEADYITLHLPKTETTNNLLNKEAFAKMKPSVFIINCARGGIINEKDLLEALNAGKVQGVALDVFDKEPVAKDDPLVMHPRVICTPHLGASSVESQINVAIVIAKQISNYFTNNEICNAINAPSMDSGQRELIQPYLNLAKKMGQLYSQYANLNIVKITIDYNGDVSSLPIKPITNSFLMGLFANSQEGVNFVNAQFIAKEMGIVLSETTNFQSQDYASLIAIKIEHNSGETLLKGAVFKEGIIRIVEVDGFTFDFAPEGHYLLTLNKDVPGFIGKIGTILGDANLNIANMELGRNKKIGKALSFIQIDTDISKSIIDKISAIPSLEKIHLISFGS